MGVARQQGGNRLLVYDDAYGEQLRGDFELQSALATVLDRNELILHYQPIIDTRYNRVVGVEALMRWMRGSQMLSPGKFIPLAEDSGLDFRMGEWAISEALQQLRRWQRGGVAIPGVSVNLSVRHLRQPSLLRSILQALEATEMQPSALTLELTEIDVMRDIENVLPTLWALKKAGIRIALDDFGTGFSSVSYLTRMPVDTLKIDRVFVSNMENDIAQLKVVRSIIALAGALDLQIIGEGRRAHRRDAHAAEARLPGPAGLPVQQTHDGRPAGALDDREPHHAGARLAGGGDDSRLLDAFALALAPAVCWNEHTTRSCAAWAMGHS